MSEIMEDIAYLSQEIGPRPAGTEEEQQAALYISDTLKNRTGFETSIEEFACNSKPDLVKVVLCVLAIIVSIAAMIVDFAVIPAILIGILCAVLYVPEALGRPLLSRALSRGVSQNVVSKYQPAARSSRRSRKVVLVASYDSGKIQKELGASGILPVLEIASLVGMVAIPILWIARAAFGMEASGPALIAWNAITIIALVLALFPVIFFIMHQVAQYNEAANCNAASVAAMIEVAQRIANTPAVAAKPDESVRIHGEEAARAEGLVPEGASIEYAAAPTGTDAPESSPVQTPAVAEEPAAEDSVQAPEEQSEHVSAEEPQQASGAEDAPEAEPEHAAGGTVAIPCIDVSELRRDAARARASQPVQSQSAEQVPANPAIELPVIEVRPEADHAKRNPLLDSPEMVADLPQIDTTLPQPAPLAGANPSLSSRIPRVNLDAFGISTAGNAEPLDNKRAALRNTIPSLSGSISFEPSAEEGANNTVSRTGSFSPVSMSGSIGPVGDELIEGVDPEDIYVDDADDSDYAENTTASGAYAGPDYIEMPESRMSRFFGKFRRKKDKEAAAEESDNRRRASRNGDDVDESAWDDDWNGGAFSKMREAAAGFGRKKNAEEAAEQAGYPEPEGDAYEADGIQSDFDAAEVSDRVDVGDVLQTEDTTDSLEEEAQPQESAPTPSVNSLASFVSELGLDDRSAADEVVEEEVKQI